MPEKNLEKMSLGELVEGMSGLVMAKNHFEISSEYKDVENSKVQEAKFKLKQFHEELNSREESYKARHKCSCEMKY